MVDGVKNALIGMHELFRAKFDSIVQHIDAGTELIPERLFQLVDHG
jgi:hypothetical protein